MPKQPRLASLSLPLCVTLLLTPISSVHQFVNGWLQGVDAYAKGLGKYHNLNKCH